MGKLPSTRVFAALTLAGLAVSSLASLFAPLMFGPGGEISPLVDPWLRLLGLIWIALLIAVALPLSIRWLLQLVRQLLPWGAPMIGAFAGRGGDRLVVMVWMVYLAGLALASPELMAFVSD